MKTTLDIYEYIGRFCSFALLSEVCVSPKPGLVDLVNNGAHNDMDFDTFLRSITAIAPYFNSFAEIGSRLNHIDENPLGVIRPLGIECENAMFEATNGVNTHKGAIFSLGILATAAGYCYGNLGSLSSEEICRAAGTIAGAAEKDFLCPGDDTMTTGLRLYAQHGIRGIRGEAASGFSSVRKCALPVMRELFLRGGFRDNDIYLQVLLHLMTEVVDTNVIARGGMEALDYVKRSAKDVLSMGGALSPEGREELFRMDEEFIRRNISPGGSADLLSVAIMLYQLETLGDRINGENKAWTKN